MDSPRLSRRDDPPINTNVTNKLLIVFLVLIVVGLACAAALFFFRRFSRKKQRSVLPFDEKDGKLAPKRSKHRRVSGITISSTAPFSRRASEPMFDEKEKLGFPEQAPSQPAGNLPQIHITFPEEVDHTGKRQSGRVVVVNIGEHGQLGLEPANDKLPPFTAPHERFVSIDLDHIGGLKEKALPQESRPY